jgi:hypothetical protein
MASRSDSAESQEWRRGGHSGRRGGLAGRDRHGAGGARGAPRQTPRPACAVAFLGPGVRGGCCLRGPRQLRDQHLRRGAVRVSSPLGDPYLQPYGDAHPVDVCQAGDRHGQEPPRSVPRPPPCGPGAQPHHIWYTHTPFAVLFSLACRVLWPPSSRVSSHPRRWACASSGGLTLPVLGKEEKEGARYCATVGLTWKPKTTRRS